MRYVTQISRRSTTLCALFVLGATARAQDDRAAKTLDVWDTNNDGALTLDEFPDGKHDRHADNEHKQWEDEIVEGETNPFRVVQLWQQQGLCTFSEDPHQADCQSCAADEPEHIEAAQGVHGKDAAGENRYWCLFSQGKPPDGKSAGEMIWTFFAGAPDELESIRKWRG